MNVMTKAEYQQLVRQLTDDGKLLEAGWTGYLSLCVPDGASAVQVEETRRAFFAGAAHLFSAVCHAMEPGAKITENDVNRVEGIAAELKVFQKQFEAKYIHKRKV